MTLKTYALTTVARFVSYAELTNLTAAQETVLEILVNQATEFIENYCDRRFQQTAYTNEVYDGDGGSTINLRQYPVASGETFGLDVRSSAENEDDWDDIDSDDYFVQYDEGIIELPDGRFFHNAPRRYRVTYTAGFDFDNSATFLSDTEAGDVEYACWLLLQVQWNKRKGDPSVISEKIGDYSVTYRKAAMENSQVMEILDKYARISYGGNRT